MLTVVTVIYAGHIYVWGLLAYAFCRFASLPSPITDSTMVGRWPEATGPELVNHQNLHVCCMNKLYKPLYENNSSVYGYTDSNSKELQCSDRGYLEKSNVVTYTYIWYVFAHVFAIFAAVQSPTMEVDFGCLHSDGLAASGCWPVIVESIMSDGKAADVARRSANT